MLEINVHKSAVRPDKPRASEVDGQPGVRNFDRRSVRHVHSERLKGFAVDQFDHLLFDLFDGHESIPPCPRQLPLILPSPSDNTSQRAVATETRPVIQASSPLMSWPPNW